MQAQNTAHFAEAAAVRAEILRLGLAVHPRFRELSDEQFAQVYNGIGPDDWPAAVRDAMTFVYRECKPLPGVHDVDFYFSDGSDAGFAATLERWRINGGAILADRYPLWQVWRWKSRALAWAKIRAAYRALQLFSRPWYDAAGRLAASRA